MAHDDGAAARRYHEATKHSLDETKGHLVTQTNRLEKATTKIEADKSSLDRAKDALAVALSQIEEAESRT